MEIMQIEVTTVAITYLVCSHSIRARQKEAEHSHAIG